MSHDTDVMPPATPRDDAGDLRDAAARGTCAVLVLYRPDLALLGESLAAIAPQVGRVVLLDNGGGDAAFDAWLANATAAGHDVLRSERNLGLAEGFNRGIARARAAGFAHVLLLDQDSVAALDMVARLFDALHAESGDGAPVAAVGAQYVDARSGLVAPFVRIGFPLNDKIEGGPGQRVDCDFLISSGSLLPMAVLDRVGAMDASLFIDNVDLDWSFRATAAGHRLVGACDARMRHSIGDALRPSRLLRHGVKVHSPLRLYYSTRNRVLLYRRAHVPRVWVAQDLPRLAGKLAAMSLLVAPRLANLRAMLRGLLDGLRGRSGPRPGHHA